MLQRQVERVCALIPGPRRYVVERRARGFFELRRVKQADYVFVSYGKSGRTWVRVMVSRLYQRRYGLKEGSLLEFENFHRASPEIPRVLFTHDNYIRDFTGDGGSKAAFRDKPVILLVRHPADVAVSAFHHWKHRMRRHKALLNGYPAPEDDVSLYEFLMMPCGLDRIIGFLNDWAREIDRFERALVVRYEDLRADAGRELGRLASFLGLDASAADIADAVDYAAFENMRNRESRAESSSERLSAGDPDNPESFKTRRGKVRGYQDDFTALEIKAIERRVDDTLHGRFGYTSPEAERSKVLGK